MDALKRWGILGLGLVVAATACGGGGAGANRDAGSDWAGATPRDLSGELLGADDLDGQWDTSGPKQLDIAGGGRSGKLDAFCPGAGTTPVPNAKRNMLAAGNARIRFESVEVPDVALVEQLAHDPTGELFAALRHSFDACVGETWDEGDDPVENTKLEAIDLAHKGDAIVGYRQLWGTDGDYDSQDVIGVVHVGGVSLALWLSENGTEDPHNGDDFSLALAAAVGHLQDGKWAAPVDDGVAPEVAEPASVSVVREPDSDGWSLVVRGNGGCRFHKGDEGIGIMDKTEISDADLPPNVEWLVRQVFAAYPHTTMSVTVDRVDVTLYKAGQSGIQAIGVDRTTAERAARDLRKRLGKRSVCGVEAATTTTTSESTTTTTTTTTTSGAAADVYLEDLRAGDCFNDTGFHGTTSGTITRVGCDAPHDGEVFAAMNLPLSPDAAYPGDDDLDNRAEAICRPRYRSYVGLDVEQSEWDFTSYLPSEDTWGGNDRLVTCVLIDRDLDKLQGSKRGSKT